MKNIIKVKLSTKRHFAILIAIIIVVLAIGGILFYKHELNRTFRQKGNTLASITYLKSNQIAEWFREELTNVQIIADSPYLEEVARNYIRTNSPADSSRLSGLLRQIKLEHESYDVILASMNGEVITSTSVQIVELEGIEKRSIKAAVNQGQGVTSDLFKCEHDGDDMIFISFIAALRDDENDPIASLVKRIDPALYLYPLIESWPRFSPTVESFIFRVEADSITILSNLKQHQNAALNLKIPVTQTDNTAIKTALGATGIIIGKDYSNTVDLSYGSRIEATPWFIVSEIARSELIEGIPIIIGRISAFILLLILFSTAFVMFIYSNRQRNIYLQLYNKEKKIWKQHEKFKITVDSLGDGVIITDIDSKVQYLNNRAKELTGWRIKEARGRDLGEIYQVKNEETGEKENNIFEIVKRHGFLKGLVNHALLVSKNGEEIPVMDTGAPVYDADGSLTGIVITFQDETEKRTQDRLLKASEEKYKMLVTNIPQKIFTKNNELIFITCNENFAEELGITPDEIAGKTDYDFFPKEHADKYRNDDRIILEKGETITFEDEHYVNGNPTWVRTTKTPVKDENGKTIGLLGIFEDITEKMRAQIALMKSEENLREFFENDITGDYSATADGELLRCNPAFAGILGFNSPDELVGRNIKEFYRDPGEREEFLKLIQVSKILKDFEVILMHKDGSELICNENIVGVFDESGSLVRYFGYLQDITKRKLAETEIINARNKAEESRLRFETLFAESPVSILIHDKDTGEVVDANKAAYTSYRFDSLEALQQNDIWMEPLYSLEDALERIQKAARDGVQVFECKSRKVTGEVFWELVTLRPMVIDGVERILSTSIDITDQKQKEVKEEVLYGIANATFVSKDLEALVVNIKKFLNKLIDTTNFYVALYDRENDVFTIPYEADEKDQIETWPAKKSTTGLVIRKKKALLLKKPAILKLIKSGEIEQIGNMCEVWLGAPLISGPDIIGVLVVQDYDNPNAYDQESKEILEFVSSQISTAIQRNKFVEDLVVAKEKAQESDRLKSAFLANMSHEIRTPMNSILGFSELLKNPQLTGDQKQRFIATIEKSGERMLNLINDIVDISKIESGQMKVHKSAVDVQDSMLFLLDFFKPEFNKNKPDVQLCLNMPPEKTTIHTDKEKLHSVLINLIKNAEKFTDTGFVEFGFRPGEGVLNFYVKDTGIGIPKDKQPQVFGRFYQVDTSLSSGYEGAGLGLPITKAFVGLLGGKIWLESEPGKGTTFYFSLPAGAETSTQPQEKEDLPGRAKDTPAKTRKILVVEDDQASYDLIRYMLDKHTKLFHAPTGEEAIGIFKKHPDIDLILMDIKMPGIDGLETTRQIREFNREIPIIAQTAYALAGDREKALEAGCNDYIAKPIKQAELLKCIERNI